GALVDFLVSDCCRGRPDLCLPHVAAPKPKRADMSDTPFNVLFICTGNSARSIFAEALLRELGGDRFRAYSAGTRPFSTLNPFAVELLHRNGHDISPLRAKTIAEFQDGDAPQMDFVFTVCDAAANEDCPPWPGQPISAHWGLPDPVKREGTDAEKALAFAQAYAQMRQRVQAFAALPIDQLDR
ncbi:arsenate reductase ArsC, partial [Escherichia coli]|nr:arsenate reductase ArsC [Escherichia coli]